MEPMTKQDAFDFFSIFFSGPHHLPQTGIKEYGPGFSVDVPSDLGTWDFNELTKLVVLAHKRCVRVAVVAKPGPRRLLTIAIWKRDPNATSTYDRHPTLEEGIRIAEEWLTKMEEMYPAGKNKWESYVH